MYEAQFFDHRNIYNETNLKVMLQKGRAMLKWLDPISFISYLFFITVIAASGQICSQLLQAMQGISSLI